MSVFSSDLNLDQEVLACGKRGKITGVMFTAAGLRYRVAFPLASGNAIGFVNEQMFSAAEVFPAPPLRPYVMLHLDGMYAVSYQTKADLDDAVKSARMQGRPYLQWVWCKISGYYVTNDSCLKMDYGSKTCKSCHVVTQP